MTSLYTRDVIRLAAEIANFPALVDAEMSAEARSATCGSKVAISVTTDGAGRVERLGWTTRACALGQASAVLMSAAAAGWNIAETREQYAVLVGYLAGRNELNLVLGGYTALEAARSAPARHSAILLPFEALQAALLAASESRNAATSESSTSRAT